MDADKAVKVAQALNLTITTINVVLPALLEAYGQLKSSEGGDLTDDQVAAIEARTATILAPWLDEVKRARDAGGG